MPLAPALVLVSGLVGVDDGTLSESELTAAVYAAPGQQSLSVWFGSFAALLLPIAAIWAGRPTYPRAPRLATLAEVLLVPGYLCLSWLVAGSDAIMWYGATNGLDPDLVTDMAWGVHPAFSVALGIFVVGHTLGTVLLGVAAIRSRAIPLWARGRAGGLSADALRRQHRQRSRSRAGHEPRRLRAQRGGVRLPRLGDLPRPLRSATGSG